MNRDLADVLDLTTEQLVALLDGVDDASPDHVVYLSRLDDDVLDLIIDDGDGSDQVLAIVGRRMMIDQVIDLVQSSKDLVAETDAEALSRGVMGTYKDIPIVVVVNFKDWGGVERFPRDQMLVLMRSGEHRRISDMNDYGDAAPADDQPVGQLADPAPAAGTVTDEALVETTLVAGHADSNAFPTQPPGGTSGTVVQGVSSDG